MGELLEREVKSLMETVAEVKKDVATVKSEVKDFKEELASVKNNLGSVKNDIVNISSNVDDIGGAVSSIGDELAQMKDKVAVLTESISSMSDSLTNMHKQLFEESLDRPSIVSILKKNREDITSIGSKVDNHIRPETTQNVQANSLINDGKKTIFSTALALITAALIGFLGKSIWDSIIDKVSEASAAKAQTKSIVHTDTAK